MIIHLVGSGPHIDSATMPQSIIITTVRRHDSDECVHQIKQVDYQSRPIQRTKLLPSVEWDSGYGTVMRQTRLSPYRSKAEEFFCYSAPLFDTVKMERDRQMMVVVKHSRPNSFVFVAPYNETAIYHFLRGEIIECGAIVLLHRGYDPTTEEMLPNETRHVDAKDTLWQRLMSSDDG